jgi:hypothetical protein
LSISYAVEPRKSFSVPLAVLAYCPAHDSVEEKVSIWFDKANESWEIFSDKERYTLTKNMQTEEKIFSEPRGQEFFLNPIEAQIVNHICKTLVKTLDGFDNDLKNKRWDKCLFLDSYFASFCCGFYHVMALAKASNRALPEVICPPDSLYDRSLESPKSDRRIAQWRALKDHVTKLRIATQELIFQTREWQKKELENTKRDPWKDQSGNFAAAYEFFIRLYFNLPPKGQVPTQPIAISR